MNLKNPLVQVNLLLHLALPYPMGDAIEPILNHLGFRIYAVNRRIGLPIEVVSRARERVSLQNACSPDIVLSNGQRSIALLIECKSSSFGSLTTQAQQARTLLLLTGPRISNYLGYRDISESTAVYVLPGSEIEQQEECLASITSELRRLSLETTEWEVWGLVQSEDGISLRNLKAGRSLDDPGDIRVVTTDDPKNYEVMRLIPVDPDVAADDPIGTQVLQERLRNSFVQQVLRHSPSGYPITVTVSVDSMCSRVILFVWEAWNPESKTWLRRKVRNYIRRMMLRMETVGVVRIPSVEPDVVQFQIPSLEVSRDLRRLLLGTENRRSRFLPDRQEMLPLSEPVSTSYNR